MIRVGIIGCGKMADQHAAQILRICDTSLVAVCDSEPLMAQQLAERFRVGKFFGDAAEMLRAVDLDVVHIITTPASHHSLGRMCLERGCNVYIEKPFTLNAGEARDLIGLADSAGLRVTAGHNAQFTPVMLKMRKLVQAGYLGGPPVHMESQYCYSFADASYAKAVIGDGDHWVRKLPGSLLQNIISHGISKIAEFMVDDHPMVMAMGFTSTFLKEIGEEGIIDEVRVIIRGRDSMTAYFTFSSQIEPVPHQFRLYGPKRSLIVDDDHQVLLKLDDIDYKSYLRYFVPPLKFSAQYMNNSIGNIAGFIRKEFHLPNDSGLKTLIELFHRSVAKKSPPPLSHKEILVTSEIMDAIFAQIGKAE